MAHTTKATDKSGNEWEVEVSGHGSFGNNVLRNGRIVGRLQIDGAMGEVYVVGCGDLNGTTYLLDHRPNARFLELVAA